MMAPLMTVEQILAAARHLSVRDKIRLIARLSPEVEQALDAATPDAGESTGLPLTRMGAPAASLLDVTGTWSGDDVETCLQIVYATRQPVSAEEDAELQTRTSTHGA